MCGIVGYVGRQAAAPLLLQGLARLEYRGYDSAGVALLDGSGFCVYKEAGRLSVLAARMNGGEGLPQTVGIGHTRWATHGAPTARNAHPHLSDNGHWAVVHNGIIENEAMLRRTLREAGVVLRSDTDSELIAQLLQREDDGDVPSTLRRVTAQLEGSFALGVLYTAQPERVYAVRCQSPLVIGVADEGVFLASDIPAVLPYTQRCVMLQDGDVACLTAEGYTVYGADGVPLQRPLQETAWEAEQAERGAYAHFMLKEIHEQPEAVAATLLPHLQEGRVTPEVLPLTAAQAVALKRVVLVGCGSAYHAGMVGAQVMERLARVPCVAEVASEYRYRQPVTDGDTLVVCISQSGETADTLAALREAKRLGARVMAVVNVEGSTLAAESEAVLLTRAGPEIAVATTKAYAAQLAALYLLAVRLGVMRGTVTPAEEQRLTAELRRLPSLIRGLLKTAPQMHALAKRLPQLTDAYFIGRGIDHAAALEASLKLKEISYIHSEAYAAGELKHGTISLMESGTFVAALACDKALLTKTLANVREVRARGAWVLLLTAETVEEAADEVLTIPAAEPLFQASLSIVPLQLLGYYTALERGCDIDHPRNLAKSVTVE